MNKKNIITTAKKELRSIFRDKKTILLICLFPLFIALFVFLYSYLYENLDEEKTIYNVGINYKLTKEEKNLFKNNNLKPIYYSNFTKMKDDLDNNELSVYITYNEQNKIYDFYYKNNQSGVVASSCIYAYFESYNKYLGDLYLVNKNLDPNIIYNNFTYKEHTVGSSNYMLELIFSMAFTYIIMAIAMASASMATSATAVEKEQGTLETILTFPITTSELVTGKYIATVIMGIFSSTLGLFITNSSLSICSHMFKLYDNIKLNINLNNILIAIAICIAASIVIAGLAIALTMFTKTYKEAQSSSQILTIITIIPLFASILELKVKTIAYIIPMFGHTQLLMDIFSGNINYCNICLTLLSSIVYGVIIVAFIIKSYKSEKVLFGS